jgi:alpha-mannosidase
MKPKSSSVPSPLLLPPSQNPTTLFVAPTVHLDWDWVNTFEQYYSKGYPAACKPVHYTLQQMIKLLHESSTFCFSLAEVGYLKRYFQDNPQAAASLSQIGKRLCLMGGGITSPDNLVCHGETFIRNYLVGTQWLKEIGIDGLRAPIAWLPDDFGHDPQLPVVLQAMGMQAVGISRVPGSAQGSPYATPLNGGASVASELMNTKGLVFLWGARDGSQLICHFMPDTYAVASSDLSTFVANFCTSQWNGDTMFVPTPSNDFATPTQQIQADVDDYNQAPVNGIKAQLATFQDFINVAQANLDKLGSPFTLRASNYWTGCFASRPKLKKEHNRAARELMAAETASVILRIYSSLAASAGEVLDSTIQIGWQALLPSTHHDFITGTSPDWTYGSEQLPLLNQAVELGERSRVKGTQLLAGSIQAIPNRGETPVIVLNSLGFQRGGLVELSPGEVASTSAVRSLSGLCPMQILAGGGLLFQIPSIASFGWSTFYLQAGNPPVSPLMPPVGESVVLENEWLSATLTRTSSWFITSFVDKQAAIDLIRPMATANEIRIYSDNGNLYQFGNEPLNFSSDYGIFQQMSTAFRTLGNPRFIEYGPLRQRFIATIEESNSRYCFTLEYALVTGEPFLRMKTTGAAPAATSVVVAFPLVSATGKIPDGLSHGTAHHWDDVEPERYWEGPTFQATHDYILPIESTSNSPYIAAIYHSDIPAWCRNLGTEESDPDKGTLLGTLLRNTDGRDRGAAGTDPADHTQEYALRVPSGLGGPTTGIPLKESLALSTPLFSKVQKGQLALPTYMSESGSLTAITPANAIVRAVRPQTGRGNLMMPQLHENAACGSPTSFALRIYNPDSSLKSVQVSLPFQSSAQPIAASLVTALEERISNSQLCLSEENLSVPTPFAITTVQIQTNRIYNLPNDGKGENPYRLFSASKSKIKERQEKEDSNLLSDWIEL